MADWGFRFTPENNGILPALVRTLTDAIHAPPDDADDQSARWETRSSNFNSTIAPLLNRMRFSGEVLCDGKASGEAIQEWTYEDGLRTAVYTVQA